MVRPLGLLIDVQIIKIIKKEDIKFSILRLKTFLKWDVKCLSMHVPNK